MHRTGDVRLSGQVSDRRPPAYSSSIVTGKIVLIAAAIMFVAPAILASGDPIGNDSHVLARPAEDPTIAPAQSEIPSGDLLDEEPTTSNLTMNASHVIAPVRLLQGSLHGIAASTVDPVTMSYIDALEPKFWRTGKNYGYSFVNDSLAPKHGTKLSFILHDPFLEYYGGADGIEPIITPGCDKATDPKCIPSYADLKLIWANYTDLFMKSVVTNKLVIEYIDILNEPDWIWDDITYEERYEIIRIAHDIIRAHSPSQKIVAPSASDFNDQFVKGFIDYAAAHDMKVDAISWHEFHRPEYVVGRAAKARAWIDAAFAAKPSLKIDEIHINEWAGGRHHLIPGWTAGYLTFFEYVGINVSTRSCWYNTPTEPGNCKFGVGGLLTIDGKTPQHVYWVHHAYAKMSGDRLMPAGSVEASSLATVVMGSRNDSSSELRFIAGKYSCGKNGLWCKYNSSQAIDEKLPAADLRIDVTDYPFAARSVEVEIERIPNEVPGPLLQPIKLPTIRMKVEGRDFSIPISGFQDGEVYSLIVRPARPGPLAKLEIAPQNSAITADEMLRFDAKGSDLDGNEVSVAPVWSAEDGTVHSNGSFEPHHVGRWRISATIENVSATALVTVIAGRLASVSIDPVDVVMRVGEFQRFSVRATDAKGNVIDEPVLDWRHSDPTIGNMHHANGTFQAHSAGVSVLSVSASSGGGNATADASIRVEDVPVPAPPPGGAPIAGIGPVTILALTLAAGIASLGIAFGLARARRRKRDRDTAPRSFFASASPEDSAQTQLDPFR